MAELTSDSVFGRQEELNVKIEAVKAVVDDVKVWTVGAAAAVAAAVAAELALEGVHLSNTGINAVSKAVSSALLPEAEKLAKKYGKGAVSN